ncbi:hypothetical protein C5167_005250, partial [Papaver somniferum]
NSTSLHEFSSISLRPDLFTKTAAAVEVYTTLFTVFDLKHAFSMSRFLAITVFPVASSASFPSTKSAGSASKICSLSDAPGRIQSDGGSDGVAALDEPHDQP